MDKGSLAPGDVVQLDPEQIANKAFAGCMLVVTEPKEWGCQGYVQALGDGRDVRGGHAYLRVRWHEMAYVGRAAWVGA